MFIIINIVKLLSNVQFIYNIIVNILINLGLYVYSFLINCDHIFPQLLL